MTAYPTALEDDILFERDTREYLYSAFPEFLYHPDLGTYGTFGIRVTSNKETYILHDVSVNAEKINSIIELLNREQLSPVHLYDVVYDLIL